MIRAACILFHSNSQTQFFHDFQALPELAVLNANVEWRSQPSAVHGLFVWSFWSLFLLSRKTDVTASWLILISAYSPFFFCKYYMQRKAEQMFNLCHVKPFKAYFLSIGYFCRNLEFLQGACSANELCFFNMDISDSITVSKLEESWFESHREVLHWWLNFQVLYNYLKNSFNYFGGKMEVAI